MPLHTTYSSFASSLTERRSPSEDAPFLHPRQTAPDDLKHLLLKHIARFTDVVAGELAAAGFEVTRKPSHDETQGAYFAGESWHVEYGGRPFLLEVGPEGDWLVAHTKDYEYTPTKVTSVAELKGYLDNLMDAR